MARTTVPGTQIRDDTVLVADLKDFAVIAATGLDVTVQAGYVRSNNIVTTKADQPLTLTNGAMNYVEMSNLGVASSNIVGFTSGSIPLASAEVFGGSSMYLNTSGDYLSTPAHVDFNLGTGDWTVDFQVMFTATNLNLAQYFLAQRDSGTVQYGFYKDVSTNGHKLAMFARNTTNQGDLIMDSAWTPVAGVWYHLAFVRNGANGYIFIDGVKQAATVTTAFGTFPSPSAAVQVGCLLGAGNNVWGYMDEVRVSKGIARWTASFTPATTRYTSDAYTSLLLHMTGTNASTTFTNSSATPKTMTAVGTAQISTAQYKFAATVTSIVDKRAWFLSTSEYTLLAGRSGGQTIIGGIAASENLTLQSTAHATKGFISIPSDNIRVGYTTSITPKDIIDIGFIPQLQLHKSDNGGILNTMWGASVTYSANLWLYKSKSTTVGTQTVVASGDTLGAVIFGGSDGTGFINAAAIAVKVDGVPGTNDMPGRLIFYTTPDGSSTLTERMRIDNGGRIIISSGGEVGSISQTEAGAGWTPFLQLNHTNNGGLSVTQWQNDTASYSHLWLSKSRSSTQGTHTIVQNGDTLGGIFFNGSDGVAFQNAATIKAFVEGTPGVDDMPGRLVFFTTPDGAKVPVERMRINNQGEITIGVAGTAAGNLYQYGTCFTYGGLAANAWVQFWYQSDQTTIGAQIGRWTANHYALAMNDGAGNRDILLYTNGVSWINSGYAFVLQAAASVNVGGALSYLQIFDAGNSGMSIVRGSASAIGARLILGKSRNTAYGSYTIVQSGDNIAEIFFAADDGTNYDSIVAKILVQVDGTPAANDTPGRMLFLTTPAGTEAAVERLRIESNGTLSVIGTTDYETLVTADDDIPNKKYVDDKITTGVVTGVVIKSVCTQYSTKLNVTTYTAIPEDDTKPTWAEGAVISGLQTAYAATNASNYLEFDIEVEVGSTVMQSLNFVMSLFKDGTGTGECVVSTIVQPFTNQSYPGGAVRLIYRTGAIGDTSSHNYDIRLGTTKGNDYAFTVNGWNNLRYLGGALISSMTIREIKA